MSHRRSEAMRIATLNPFVLTWTLPLLMYQEWLSICLSATASTDHLVRNPKGTKQLPVPGNIQDSMDHDIFA